MKRSLSLLIVFAVCLFATTGSAGAISQRSLGSIQAIVGTHAFSYPAANKIRLQDLRTGKVQHLELPNSDTLAEWPARQNSHAAVIGSRPGTTTPAELWLTTAVDKPKLLTSVERDGPWCSSFNSIVTFQISPRNAVLALTQRFKAGGLGCPLDVNASELALYRPDGIKELIVLPAELRTNLQFLVAARGSRLLFQINRAGASHFIVFDFKSDKTIWEGDRPYAYDVKLLADHTIGSIYDPDDRVGWAERFNYQSKKVVHISLTPGMNEFCGRFLAHAALGKVTVFDQRGHALYKRRTGHRSSFGAPVCSSNYLLVRLVTSVDTTTSRTSFRLLDLTKIRR